MHTTCCGINVLQNLCWQPTPPIAFVVTKPKAREVYAAQFEDRVIHHLLINELEVLLDSQFIFDAASNRKNKGTHFAVNCLQKIDAKSALNSVTHNILIKYPHISG
jgi:RNA-directed DNA polymerase